MKVILLDEVNKLGEKGKLVEVAGGFARNYLIPQKLAVPATKGNLKALSSWKKEEDKKEKRQLKRVADVSEALSKKQFRFKMKEGEAGKVFGSITSQDIAEMVNKEMGVVFDKKWVQLEEPLRHLGSHIVKVRYAKDIEGELNIEIIPEEQKQE